MYKFQNYTERTALKFLQNMSLGLPRRFSKLTQLNLQGVPMSCTTLRYYSNNCTWNLDCLNLHRIPHQLQAMRLSFLYVLCIQCCVYAKLLKPQTVSSRPRWQGWRFPKWSVPLVRLVKGWWCLAAGWRSEMSKWISEEVWRCWSEEFFADTIIGAGIASNIYIYNYIYTHIFIMTRCCRLIHIPHHTSYLVKKKGQHGPQFGPAQLSPQVWPSMLRKWQHRKLAEKDPRNLQGEFSQGVCV